MTATSNSDDGLLAHQASNLVGGGITHGFFTRLGGISQGLYQGLNCGYGSDDSAQNVRENRARATARLGLDRNHLNTLYQCHSSDVLVVDKPWDSQNAPKGDAMVTRVPGLGLGILTADCAPVLLADPIAGIIGAAHAGWRGAIAGVTDAVVDAMERLGAERQHIHCAIGHALTQRNYEVGPEFRAQFADLNPQNECFFISSHDTECDRSQFDLTAYVRTRLLASGVASVQTLGLCTYAREDEFFSYRRTTHRSEPDYGRNLTAICLHEN